jgi:hypothetical protein
MPVPLAEIIRFAFTVLVPGFLVMAAIIVVIMRQRTPKAMRWPQKKDNGRRARVRDVPPMR